MSVAENRRAGPVEIVRRPHSGRLRLAPPSASHRPLSPRELAVLVLVADGCEGREIGERLGVSNETVRSHTQNMRGKLQARSRAHAITIAYRRGIFRAEDGCALTPISSLGTARSLPRTGDRRGMSTLATHPLNGEASRISQAELVRRLRQGELRLVARDGDTVRLRPPVEIYDIPSERELEVLRLVADGLVNTEIAKRLWLSPETVKSHVSSIFGKLGVKTRAQAVAVGFRSGLLG